LLRRTEQESPPSPGRHDLADASCDPEFDEIVQAAADVCEAPIALLSSIEEGGQVFLAEIGLPRHSALLDDAFCPLNFIEQDLLVVPDATRDPRFHSNPLLAAEGVRFYACAPMSTPEGLLLGAISVIDRKPRDITATQGRMLKALARHAMTLLQLRRTLRRKEAQQQEATETQARMESVLDTGMAAFFDWDVPSATIRGDRRLVEHYGLDPAIVTSGLSLAGVFAAIHPDDLAALNAGVTRAVTLATDYSTQFRLLDREGAERWVLVRGRCSRAEGGRPLRYSGVVVDIGPAKQAEDALREAQAQQQTVMKELAHRTKNTLAVVQALANQTLRSAASLDEAKRSLNAWLPALARAVDALIQTHSTGAEIQDVAHGILPLCDPDGIGRIAFSGPDLRIGAQPTLALTLALHELATNAMKYGALSVPQGRVEVAWRLSGKLSERRLQLDWRESGGPPVTAPRHRGFGSRLIKDNLESATRGRVELAFPEAGFSFALDAPYDIAER
jgi:two-component sensor histidine kinase/PAS domain-containing protein